MDRRAFFAVANRSIGRYDRKSGTRTAHWTDTTGEVVHLDGCEAWRGRLYCAQSNYPHLPMTSSIEVFDAKTLAHVGHRSLGLTPGSLTWVSRHEHHWWLCFANYSGHGGQPSRDNRSTTIVEYDDAWHPGQAWVLPPPVLSAFAGMSASGGAWGPGGFLYVSGHDRPELYVLARPEYGSVLRHVATIRVPGRGQGFGWDPTRTHTLFTIDRKTKTVISSVVPTVPPTGN